MKSSLKQIKKYADYLDDLANRNIDFGKVINDNKTSKQDQVRDISSAINKFRRDFNRNENHFIKRHVHQALDPYLKVVHGNSIAIKAMQRYASIVAKKYKQGDLSAQTSSSPAPKNKNDDSDNAK